MPRVCNFSSADNEGGIVDIPVESASKTRSVVKCARNSGTTRSGFAEILSSSKQAHEAKAGESDTKKLAEMSSARSVEPICGTIVVKKAGTELGVLDPPTNRCVIPETEKNQSAIHATKS